MTSTPGGPLAPHTPLAPSPLVGNFARRLADYGLSSSQVASVFDALRDISAETSHSTLTSAEMEFALSAGMDAHDFSVEAAEENVLHRLRSTANDAERLRKSLLNAEQVATLLGVKPATVRQWARRGHLYSVHRPGGRVGFPRWQFAGECVLPGLREVLAALPSYLHPLDVEEVMTQSDEYLDERSPVDWLASGEEVARVLRLIEDLWLT